MPVISDQEPAHQRLFDVPPGSNFQLNLLRNLGDSLETPRCCLLSKVAADHPQRSQRLVMTFSNHPCRIANKSASRRLGCSRRPKFGRCIERNER
jgi:hypothetical protein